MHLLSLNRAIEAFDSHGLRAQNDKLLDVQDMITILTSLYELLANEHPTIINLPLNIDLIINWILNVYDRFVVHNTTLALKISNHHFKVSKIKIGSPTYYRFEPSQISQVTS